LIFTLIDQNTSTAPQTVVTSNTTPNTTTNTITVAKPYKSTLTLFSSCQGVEYNQKINPFGLRLLYRFQVYLSHVTIQAGKEYAHPD
jgi:hypothetical protein